MRLLIILLTLMTTLSQMAAAQKLQKAFAMVYGGGDTAAALKIFNKSIKKHREVHAAYYGLGLCAMPNNPKEAFINFKKVDGKFRNSAKDFKRYMHDSYGITKDSARNKMDEIVAMQLRRVIMNDSTERGFTKFMSTYSGCTQKFLDRAAVLKEDAAYREARKDKSLEKAKQFTYNYPNSRRLNFIMEYIDSVEYYSQLEKGTRGALFKYINAYNKGKLFSLKSERIQAKKSIKLEYYTQAVKLSDYLDSNNIARLTDEYINNWRKEVYYSGHWQRLGYLYERLPHLMVDSMRQMYYAGKYAEDNFAMQEMWAYYGNVGKDYYAQKDSIYDFYIRRGAPSRLALRRMQELYKDYMSQGKIDSVLAIINRYEPLFPNFSYEIEQLKHLLSENKDSCRRVRLPDIINEPPLQKPIIKYYNIKGRKVPYVSNFISFGRLKLFDCINKYPVISPDGTRLYLTHWDYKPVSLKQKYEFVHLRSKKRIVVDRVRTDTVKQGIGICYSDFKNGRWQPLQRLEGLFMSDSVRIDTIATQPETYAMNNIWAVPSQVALEFLNDKTINATRTDNVGLYFVGERAVSRDRVTTFTSGISADNTVMYVIRPEKMQWGTPEPPAKPEYYVSKVIDVSTCIGSDKWSKPQVCGKVNHYPVTMSLFLQPHPYFGSMNAHPSPDNKTLFFSAGRKGVPGWRERFTVAVMRLPYGGELSAETYINPFIPQDFSYLQPLFYPDLWFSTKDENGVMGYPVNLGPDLNTEYGEYSPVLAADNKTLYFISNGHSGIGGTDIYMSKRRKEGSWTEWTAPINLGKYINTPYDEHDFSITADGKTAYYTSEEPLTHRQIIYKVDLPMIFRPDTICIYKGKITNLSKEPVNARIRVIDDLNKRTYAEYRTQPNGEFYFGLPQDRPYRFVITAKNAVSATDTLGCYSQMSIVKKHDFILPDSADVFGKRLPIPIVEDDGLDVIGFLKKYEVPALEITVTAPYKSAAETTAEDLKKRFLSVVGGAEERITTVVKTGKMKVEVKVVDAEVGE